MGMFWNVIPSRKTSKVTLELRELIDGGVNIWDFEYPSYYKDKAKTEFEQKVIDHFYFRQIGQETPGRWLHYFRTRIREIMPYYIQLYKSVELMENAGDPFEAYNLTETYEEDTTGTSSVQSGSEGLSETTTNNEHRFSNTPQGSINNIDNYLTEATKDNNTLTTQSEDDSTSTGETSGTKKYTMTRRGNIGVQPLGAEINVYRSALIDVDNKIINELNDLFLLVY